MRCAVRIFHRKAVLSGTGEYVQGWDLPLVTTTIGPNTVLEPVYVYERDFAYRGELSEDELEAIFAENNRGSGQEIPELVGFRSLSVGDVVDILGFGYFLVEVVGFTRVQDEEDVISAWMNVDNATRAGHEVV